MRKKNNIVHGIGVNDSLHSVIPKNGACCPFYAKWHGMMQRCYSEAFQAKGPSYVGCKVCDSWLTFSNFRSWMRVQDHEGLELDKDLLGDGKLYSPETCVFVTRQVNTFTNDHGAARGEWPIGVCMVGNRFRARCGGIYLGTFDTPQEAHQAWVTAKQEQAVTLIEQQTDIRVAQGLWQYALSLAA